MSGNAARAPERRGGARITAARTTSTRTTFARITVARIALGGLGIAAMGYALAGAIGNPDITPSRHLLFLVAVLIANDGLLLPLVIGAGALVRRHVPVGPRAVVQAALIITAALLLVALPLVLGYGRRPDNPSALPLDYLRGFVELLAVIWLITAIVLLVRQVRTQRTGRRAEPVPGPREPEPESEPSEPEPSESEPSESEETAQRFSIGT